MTISISAIDSISHTPSCSIQLEKCYAAGLDGLDEFSHIIVIWYAADPGEVKMTLKRPYLKGPEELGLFATRSPLRPSGLCISTAEIISIDTSGPAVMITWIDADQNSPVLDIKPYHPSVDRVRDVRLPGWCSQWPGWYEDSSTFDWESVFSCP